MGNEPPGAKHVVAIGLAEIVAQRLLLDAHAQPKPIAAPSMITSQLAQLVIAYGT
jgi:hypothetical protein